MARELEVRVNDQLVGHLREDSDLWQFGYAAVWQDSPQGFDLSPALPRTQAWHIDAATTRPVQWYFDNLLPEEALRTVVAREAGLHAEDAFGLFELAEGYALTAPRDAFDRVLRRFLVHHARHGALLRRLTEAGLWSGG